MNRPGIAEEAEKLYTPSYWSQRITDKNMTNTEILNHYISVCKTGSDQMMEKYQDTIIKIEVTTPTGNEVSYVFKPDNNTFNCMFVYIHGGCWTEGSARDNSLHMAEVFIKNGFHYAALSYKDTEPKGALSDLVRTTVLAVNKICDYAKSLNISSVVISGHSAGGHLTAMLLCDSELSSLARKMIKGLIPLSGVFDLKNLLKTSVLGDHPYLQVYDNETADQLSPLVHMRTNTGIVLNNLHLILLLVGEEESPAFISETQLLHQELLRRQQNGDIRPDCLIEEIILKHTDHFNLVTSLVADSLTSETLLKHLLTLCENSQ